MFVHQDEHGKSYEHNGADPNQRKHDGLLNRSMPYRSDASLTPLSVA